MITIRAWVVQTLMADSALAPLVGPRVYPRESLDSSVIDYPYLIVGLGNATAEDLSEDPADYLMEPERQFFQVWIHDKLTPKGGSYLEIDNMIPMVKAALRGKSNTANNIIDIKYLETSAEFANQTLSTVYRYIRFQAIRGKVKA